MHLIWDTLWDVWWPAIPRIVRKVFLLVIAVVLLVALPIMGVFLGNDCEVYNMQGKIDSGWTPEEARIVTWDWSCIGFWTGLVFGLAALLFAVLYSFSEDRQRSV